MKLFFPFARAAAVVLGGMVLAAQPGWSESPFRVASQLVTNAGPAIQVRFSFPTGHHLYAERIAFRWEGQPESLKAEMPASHLVLDKFSGEKSQGYEAPFAAHIGLPGLEATNRTLEVAFQGCDEAQCYFPETRRFAVSATGQVSEIVETSDIPAGEVARALDWRPLAAGFQVAKRGTGYMDAEAFDGFLDSSATAQADADDSTSFLKRWGWVATVGLILLGGLGLNLTPCILPMIPINLAIIGAGAGNKDRRRGLALGATYGVGMAMAYGTLGLVVVLTGSKFGTLNSSPWFNLAIAVVFAVLCLAMFDKLSIDFSRWQNRFGGSGGAGGARGPFVVALTMGAVSALLAGACVAPVVISVLLLAAHFYNQGFWLGLLLPFLLGLGMALPWPAAGAGLALLPKPGAWMTRVKYGFGVVIALFALYYGHLAYTLFPAVSVFARQNPEVQSGATVERSIADLTAAMQASQQDGKPVLVDFWASWCKNCAAMEHTTFQDEKIKQRLGSFHFVKFQAEHPDDPVVKSVLDQFGAMGLPTYVVLRPAGVPSDNVKPSVLADQAP